MRDHTIVHRPLLDSPAEYTLACLLAGLAGMVGIVWASGQIAGLVFGFAWLDTSPGEAISAAWQLPTHAGDPAAVWPARVRDDLPGPVGFWTVFALTAAGVGAAVLWGVKHLRGRPRTGGFASRRDLAAALSPKAALARADRLRPNLTTKPEPCDVSVDLGRAKPSGMALAAPIDASVIVVAAPRTGKSSQVIIPWLADWPGPAVVTSVRPDVATNTYQIRQSRGPVAVFDLSDVNWPDRAAWSPTTGCASFDKARQRADIMVTVGKSNTSADSTNAGFFGQNATNLLAAWLHAADLHGLSISRVVEWALADSNDEPVHLLRDHHHAAPGIAALVDAIYHSPWETRSNLWATVQTAVAGLLSDGARRVFDPAPGTGFDIETFLRESGTIYLHVPEHQAGDLAPIVAAFVDEITHVAKRLGDAHSTGRLDPPLGMVLDEVANVVPLPNLPSLMSYAAGSGIFVTAVLQHVAGARQRWGKDGADALWGAATCKIALGGLSGDELEAFSTLAGTYREKVTTPQHSRNGIAMSTQLQERRTLDPAAIRTLATDEREALVIYSTTPAVKTRMRRHYETRHAKAFAASETELHTLTHGTTRPPEAIWTPGGSR